MPQGRVYFILARIWSSSIIQQEVNSCQNVLGDGEQQYYNNKRRRVRRKSQPDVGWKARVAIIHAPLTIEFVFSCETISGIKFRLFMTPYRKRHLSSSTDQTYSSPYEQD